MNIYIINRMHQKNNITTSKLLCLALFLAVIPAAYSAERSDSPATEFSDFIHEPPELIETPAVYRGEWSGYVATEYRGFLNDPTDPRQHGDNLSLSLQPEYYYEYDGGRQLFSFIPFLRIDEHDDERSHFDIRELTWEKITDDWELRLGIRKLFWGVTESQHLVDIINQTDLVESPDGEEKLGQPMVNLALIRDWGTVDLFILPGFRERSFPGTEGRLRTEPYVDTDNARFESSREERHIDLAVRWSHYIGDWDFGLSHFYGTSRAPNLLKEKDAQGNDVFIPLYKLINQTGIDVQATKGSWLWKLEAIHLIGQGHTSNAITTGFEYTFYGILESATDLGLVVEYLYDDLGSAAATPFSDDIMLGLRFALNDEQSTEALIGGIMDTSDETMIFQLEASRRLGANWKIELESRLFNNIPDSDPLYDFRNDDYVQIDLSCHF